MAKYDPNWLMKLKSKQWANEEKSLSHILVNDGSQHPPAICGKGWGAKGHPSITVCQFPSIDSLPSCYTCRVKFLESIEVEYDVKTGQPNSIRKY